MAPQKNSKLFTYLSIGSALLAAVMMYSFLSSLQSKATGVVNAVVAVQDIPENTILNKDAVRLVSVPSRLAGGRVIGDPNKVDGMVTKVPLSQGEVLFDSKLVSKADFGSVSSITGKGFRAFAISADKLLGVPDNLREGDYVDVSASFPTDVYGVPTAGLILENVQVLAVGTKEDTQMAISGKNGTSTSLSSVTLAVSPENEGKIAFAVGHGNVVLAVRTKDDPGSVKPYSIGPDQVFK